MCEGVSTGESGLLVDAIIHWDEIKLGKKIHDYKTTRMEYLDKVDANLGACRDIDPGWGGEPRGHRRGRAGQSGRVLVGR